MTIERSRGTLRFTTSSLILTNLIPLGGVLFFGWSAVQTTFLYVLEAGILGLVGAIRIAVLGPTVRQGAGNGLGFLVLFGLFYPFPVLVFILFIFEPLKTVSGTDGFSSLWEIYESVRWPLAAMLAGNLASLVVPRSGARPPATFADIATDGLVRMFILTMCLAYAGSLCRWWGGTTTLAILVLMKTFFDAAFHVRTRSECAVPGVSG